MMFGSPVGARQKIVNGRAVIAVWGKGGGIRRGGIEVIEHLPDPNRLLCEINRILKPGGQLIITTPCANPFSLEWFCAHLRPGGRIPTPYGVRWYVDDVCHLDRMTSKTLRKRATDSGLSFKQFYFWHHYLAKIDTRIGPWVRSPGRRFSARPGD